MHKIYTLAEINNILSDLRAHFIKQAAATIEQEKSPDKAAGLSFILEGGMVTGPDGELLVILVIKETLSAENLSGKNIEVSYDSDAGIVTVQSIVEHYSAAKDKFPPKVRLVTNEDPFVALVSIPGYVKGGNLGAKILAQ